jgi:nicotinamidase-related amidase
MPARNRDLHGFAPDTASTALLILDLISDFEFPDGEAVLRAALPVAARVRRLKARARAAGIPTIYVNDNFGRWRSDFRELVQHCLRSGARGAEVVRLIEPDPEDYFILKPKHSGFYATALETLLTYIGVDTVILAGVSTHQCVLFTANDAYVRDLHIMVPSDCVAAVNAGQTRFALRYFSTVLRADVRASARLRLPPSPASKPRSANARRASTGNGGGRPSSPTRRGATARDRPMRARRRSAAAGSAHSPHGSP